MKSLVGNLLELLLNIQLNIPHLFVLRCFFCALLFLLTEEDEVNGKEITGIGIYHLAF